MVFWGWCKNHKTLSDYETADREGILAELQSEIETVKALDADAAPSSQQVSNKDTLKKDIDAIDVET